MMPFPTQLTDAIERAQFREMRHWSRHKLEKERMFAEACNDRSPEAARWLGAIIEEQARRAPARVAA